MNQFDRRAFLKTSLAAAAVGAVAQHSLAADAAKPKLKKAVKFAMIGEGKSIQEKFELIKSLGFLGVEFDSPDPRVDREEAVKARDATGIVIHGTIDSIHWGTRLSDPNPEIRAKGLKGLKTAIDDYKFYGGTTALLVPGKVTNKETENFDQVWSRSQEEIRKVIPQAEKAGVKIAIEVVWNDFITTPEQLVKYVDEFKSPTVGAYFDCSNMIKYGVAPATWIRKLGPRMLKFDFKGYSNTKKWVGIGEGDEDWPEILKALAEVKYEGWATAEVGAGGRDHLKDVSQRMDKILGLG